MLNIMVQLVLCHLIGDYVLQNDFIAQSKGHNMYHMFVHSALYIVPFYILLGPSFALFIVFVMHMLIDLCKAKFGFLCYAEDQILHYILLFILL